MSGWRALALAPLGLLYGSIMRLRRALYTGGVLPRRRLTVPVVSIGNLSLGGTGKTPFAAWLAAGLRDRGVRVAIVLRGYGRDTRGVRVVSDGQRISGDPRSVGDEALLLARDLPGVAVVVGENRHRAGATAVRELGAAVVILDDGFQHLGLARDLDIVLLDGCSSPWRERVLPAGRLREPGTALRAADILLITRAHIAGERWAEVADWACDAFGSADLGVFAVDTRPRRLVDREGHGRDLEALRGTAIVALAAVGSPAQFEADLDRLGATRAATLRFRDHHRFSAADLSRIEDTCRASGAAWVVTTAKDLVRLDRALAVPVWALEIDAYVREEVALWRRLQRVIPGLEESA